jgi:acyl-CoA synthetase (AMP-forming)/AMP-acid ligase II
VTDVEQRVRDVLERYASPGACAAALLCDEHPPNAVAITLIAEDLSAVELRYGALRAASERAASEAVAECAVIAVPDEARGEVIEAVVVPRAPHAPSDELARELQQLVKERYAAHAYPRTVRFADRLPKTESGKIQRAVLRRERIAELQSAAGADAS